MANLKLSIIIPVYNSMKYLNRCLHSVFDCVKDHPDVEVLIIDDGSTDEFVNIESKYDNFKIIRHESNRGVSAARNTGIDMSQGEWITFLDSDDTYTRSAVDIMLTAISKHSDYNMIQFNHDRYYTEINKRVTKYANEAGSYDGVRDLFRINMWYMVWNTVYRKSFIEEHHIRFLEGMNFGEDELFNLNCMKHDSRLYHAYGSTVLRYFDNKQSLSRSVTQEALLKQTDEAIKLLLNSSRPAFRDIIRRRISDIWNSGLYRAVFRRRESK